MPSFTERRSYRTFGALYAVTIGIVVLLRGAAAGHLHVGLGAAIAFGGAGFAVFWWLGENQPRTGRRDGGEWSIRAWWGDRESVERAGRIATAGIWFLGVYLLYTRGVRLGVVGIAVVTALNCVVLWKAAVAVPLIERWLKTGS